jgi:hypothetical protein
MTHDEAVALAPGYVLHALEPAEDAAVRGHLASCGLPHPEFEELGGVVPSLLELDESEMVEPPAALRDRVMAAAAADLEERTRAERTLADRTPAAESSERTFAERTRVADAASERTLAAPTVAEPTLAERTVAEGTPTSDAPIPFPSAPERAARAERTRASRLDWLIRIAAVVAIAALGAWGLNLQAQLNESRSFDAAVATVLQAANQPGAKVAVLAPAQGQQGSGLAAIQSDGSVVLAMHELPASSGGEVYTAWVIVPDQAPTSVGDFAVDSSGVEQFTSRPTETPAGATIAITREPNAGNTAPQGPVVSAGVATAPGGTS